jgi:hypothetical protein
MASRGGRPPLTEEVIKERIADYCARYGVTAFNEAGFPAFPAGKRETRQHREWVVLYKALSRLRKRQHRPPAGAGGAGRASDVERASLLEAQKRRCRICGKRLSADEAELEERGGGGGLVLLHPTCRQLVRLVAPLGAAVLDRLRDHLWPRGPDRGRGRSPGA